MDRTIQQVCIVVLLFAKLNADDTCPSEFQGKCWCGYKHFPRPSESPKKFLVNCTNGLFKDTTPLEYLPPQTQAVIFTGNYLGELPDNIFGFDDNDLEYVDLSNNHITFIPGKCFHKVKNVETLILNYNDIVITEDKERPRIFSNFENLKYLHLTDAFTDKYNASSYYLLKLENIFRESFLSNLVKLHLEQNEIWSIGANESIFCPLRSLEQLYLSDNKLSDMDFRIDCLPKLTYMNLQFNMINRLSQDALNRLDSWKAVSNHSLILALKDNPFICDCLSSGFLQWLKNTKVELRDYDIYTCTDGYPKENINKYIKEVEYASCPTGVIVITGYAPDVVGVLAFLLVFTSTLVIIIAYFHRNKVKKAVQPYMDYLTRKIGYTGLAAEEVPREVSV